MKTKQDIMRNALDTLDALDTANTANTANTPGCACDASARETMSASDDGAARMPGCGWLKLYRCFTEWEWYGDTNTVRLFLHLLLKANYRERRWKGRTIARGSLATSLASLAAETSLSVQNVRTCLAHLKSTGEINIETTPCYTLITINNYGRYQDGGTCSDTFDRQSPNTASTSSQHSPNKPLTTTKEIKKEINKKNILSKRESSGFAKAQPALAPQEQNQFGDLMSPCSGCETKTADNCAKCPNAAILPGTNTVKNRGAAAADCAAEACVAADCAAANCAADACVAADCTAANCAVRDCAAKACAEEASAAGRAAAGRAAESTCGSRRGAFVAPSAEQVRRYAASKGLKGVDAEAFTDYYSANGWRIGKAPMRDWQAAVRNWARRQELMDACTLRRSAISATNAHASRNILNVNDQWKDFVLPKR